MSITKFTISTKTEFLIFEGVDFLEATMTSKELTTRDAIGEVYTFKKNCDGEDWVPQDAHVTIQRSICGCRKCGAYSVFHKV